MSTDYWPWVWPSPETVSLSLFTGGASSLALPVRPRRPADAHLAASPSPNRPRPPDCETIAKPGSRGRRVDWDIDTGTMTYEYRYVDGGRYRDARTGIETEDHCVYSYSLTEGDPLSAVARLNAHSDLIGDAELDVRVDTTSELRADARDFVVTDEQHVYDHGEQIFEKKHTQRIPRDLV